MDLQVVGAGVGRTGTTSLKIALEQLLGNPCYHMIEVLGHPEHVAHWQDAADGNPVAWDQLFDGYVAAVDWPVASFWPEMTATYPDALVILSTRATPETWWKSTQDTIFHRWDDGARPGMEIWRVMFDRVLENRFTTRVSDPEAAMAAYEAHNAAVRAAVPASRLLEWQPGDGWAPICERLGVAVPADPFPVANTTAEFRELVGWA